MSFSPLGNSLLDSIPPKKPKNKFRSSFWKKRGLYFELEREKTIRRYKNIYFNGHLWCKYHTNTTSIPTKSPSLSMKVHVLTNHKCLSKSRQRLQNFYGALIWTDPVRIEKTTGYSGREMNEIYWKLVSRAAHPLINQLLWLKRNETELQFGLNNFHSGLTKATSLVDSNFSFWLVADFSFVEKYGQKMIFHKVQFGFISSIIQDRSGSYYRKERQLRVPPYIGLVPFIGMVRQFGKSLI